MTKTYQGGTSEAANSAEGRQALESSLPPSSVLIGRPFMIAATLPPLYNGRLKPPPFTVVRKRSRESHGAIEDTQFIPWGEHEGYDLHRVSVCPPWVQVEM